MISTTSSAYVAQEVQVAAVEKVEEAKEKAVEVAADAQAKVEGESSLFRFSTCSA